MRNGWFLVRQQPTCELRPTRGNANGVGASADMMAFRHFCSLYVVCAAGFCSSDVVTRASFENVVPSCQAPLVA